MTTLIRNGIVLPMEGRKVSFDPGSVLIVDDKIVAVGKREDVLRQAAPGARRHDFGASTLLAGLFNSHVHLAFDAGQDPLGTLENRRCEWPSSCCSPSPLSVVRPAVAPRRKPRPRASPNAQIWSIVRWNPNIE